MQLQKVKLRIGHNNLTLKCVKLLSKIIRNPKKKPLIVTIQYIKYCGKVYKDIFLVILSMN